jgi:hypothetical protein
LVIKAKQTPQDVSSEDDMEAEACARTDHPPEPPSQTGLLRDNLDENGATIWMRRGGRAERQLTMAVVLARL